MQRAYLIPAYQASRSLKQVLDDLRFLDPEGALLVVDDGSTDGTGDMARASGIDVVTHETNLGKGIALKTGFAWLAERGFETAVTVDADGQHRAEDAVMRVVNLIGVGRGGRRRYHPGPGEPELNGAHHLAAGRRHWQNLGRSRFRREAPRCGTLRVGMPVAVVWSVQCSWNSSR